MSPWFTRAPSPKGISSIFAETRAEILAMLLAARVPGALTTRTISPTEAFSITTAAPRERSAASFCSLVIVGNRNKPAPPHTMSTTTPMPTTHFSTRQNLPTVASPHADPRVPILPDPHPRPDPRASNSARAWARLNFYAPTLAAFRPRTTCLRPPHPVRLVFGSGHPTISVPARPGAVHLARRVLHDEYFKRAKAEGYLARSAYKLLQIQEAKRLIRTGQRVLDLGC
ncbi:MAG TPA: hypothetical protein DEB06_01200, partial [Phycisphaerales bacterium]|nr:hypothetical protein [Phycisphaerales bacterium]